jgi:hypothetical protein
MDVRAGGRWRFPTEDGVVEQASVRAQRRPSGSAGSTRRGRRR